VGNLSGSIAAYIGRPRYGQRQQPAVNVQRRWPVDVRRFLFDLAWPFILAWGCFWWFIANCGDQEWDEWVETHMV
jgi:hypothetical protein